MRKTVVGIVVATVFWFIMFSPWTKDSVNFWAIMLVATLTLTAYAFYFDKDELKSLLNFKAGYVIIGLLSAALLYLIFYAGNYFSRLLFDFSSSQIENIYATKNQADNIMIGLALFFWIGPAEEVFWRGFVQSRLMKSQGEIKGIIVTTLIYAFVHIWALNFMLFMAALICGLFWGFMFYKYKSLLPVLISHAVWDAFIFVVLPIS